MIHTTRSNQLGNIVFAAVFVLVVIGLPVAYFVESSGPITVNALASDNWSILPMVQKLDNPSLFKYDQFLYSLHMPSLYIPAFTHGVLVCAKLVQHNIMQGYNLFNAITVFLHLALWFLALYRFTKNKWLALLFALLMRGILWPPGNEIWGAGPLQYFLPRTVFSSLLPLFFIAFHYLWQRNFKWVPVSFLLLGMVGNFHPISAMGNGMAAIGAAGVLVLLQGKGWRTAITTVLLCGIAFSIGIGPYVYNHLSNDVSQAGLTYDKNLLTSLVRYRINPGFSNPWLLYSRYIQPQWFLLIAGSYVLSYFFRKQAVAPLALIRFLWLFGGFILAAPLVFYGLEQLAHALGYTYINYSFELSRTGKYIIIPAFLLYAIGIQGLLHTYLPAASQQKWPALAVPVFIAVCWLAMGPLRQWPVLKADFFRAQLPEAVTGYTYLPYQYAHLDSALAFIKANTPEDATFLGEPQIRGGSLRSVPYDHKGASVLLTYEKPKYIEWALKRKVEISIKDPQEKVNFFRSLGTDYMLTDYLYSNTDSLVYQNQQYRLYKMIRREPQQP